MNTADSEWAARSAERIPRLDRTGWPAGPWDDEPDRVEWRYHGTPRFPLLMVRSFTTGVWCGYVGVPPGHPCHGRRWDEAPTEELRTHGGVNFSNPCNDGGFVCHVPRPGESPDVWWLGFDCGHAWDVHPMLLKVAMPAAIAELLQLKEMWEYRTAEYVRRTVEELADQLARMAKGTGAP